MRRHLRGMIVVAVGVGVVLAVLLPAGLALLLVGLLLICCGRMCMRR
ncbi:MAG: hypothetical protein IKD79_05755 [Oscillospiraceae bacterium]|nr:hypothetical protein [Oscillospiraceae bacterium]